MAIKIIDRTVPLDGDPITETLPSTFFDGESTAHQFIIHATRGGQSVTLSGTVAGVFLNANDETVAVTDGSIEDDAAVITLSDACYHVNGRFTFSVNVANQTVYCCKSSISRRSSTTTYDPSGVLPSISELLDAIGDMETATAAAEAIRNAKLGTTINASILKDNTIDWTRPVTDSDNKGYAIGTGENTAGQLVRLGASETSDMYPCTPGDSLYLNVYTNAVRWIVATYDANGDYVSHLASDRASESTASNFKAYTYTFSGTERFFRVSHSIPTTGVQQRESVVYLPAKMGYGMKIDGADYDGFPIDGIVTPAMFGAAGDAAVDSQGNVTGTDDTEALQSLFDYAYLTGRTIRFPKGKTYLVTRGILLRSYSPDNRSYYVNGSNGTANPNIIFTGAYDGLFTGENLQTDAASTTINIVLRDLTARNYDNAVYGRKGSFMRRITMTNESLMEGCKLMFFDVVFEASTAAVCSLIRGCTFYGFRTAFMTHKHRKQGDESLSGYDADAPLTWFTRGTAIGFMSDSKMLDCYLSGYKQAMPPMFIGTHLDTDTLIANCFIEWGRAFLSGGYTEGFNGGIFTGCDFQGMCRLSDCGITNAYFSNCYFSGFSYANLLNRVGPESGNYWTGIIDWEEKKMGVFCTDEEDGSNTQNAIFDFSVVNCVVSNCDRFIDLNGTGTGDDVTRFLNSAIVERGTRYRNEPANSVRVHFKGDFSFDGWSDTLNCRTVQAITGPVDEDGNLEDAFKGQTVFCDGSVYIAGEYGGSPAYYATADIATIVETKSYLGYT